MKMVGKVAVNEAATFAGVAELAPEYHNFFRYVPYWESSGCYSATSGSSVADYGTPWVQVSPWSSEYMTKPMSISGA